MNEPAHGAGAGGSPPRRRLRHRVYLALEGGPASGTVGAMVDGALIALIIANVVAYTLQSVPAIETSWLGDLVEFEIASVTIFTIEYLLRLWAAPEDPLLERSFAGARPSALRLAAADADRLPGGRAQLPGAVLSLSRFSHPAAFPPAQAAQDRALFAGAVDAGAGGGAGTARAVRHAAADAVRDRVCGRGHACGRRGRPAQGLRHDPRFHVVGDHDADHGRLWRCGADDRAGADGRRR